MQRGDDEEHSSPQCFPFEEFVFSSGILVDWKEKGRHCKLDAVKKVLKLDVCKCVQGNTWDNLLSKLKAKIMDEGN